MRSILVLLVLGLAGHGLLATAAGRLEQHAPQAAPTQELVGLARTHSMLLVGELHGTVEAPALVEGIALALAEQGPVIVALEWPTSEQPRVDSYLAGDADAGTVTASPFWSSSMRDGRSSRAMLDLLTSLRRARSAGARIEVVCFDGPPASGDQGNREAGLAHHLRQARERLPDARMLVLTGNYHARLTRGTAWDPDKALMGYLLRDLEPFNVDVRAVRGGAWICLSDGGCGVHEFDHGSRGLEAGLVRHGEANATGYLSTLVLPLATPSPPAVPEAEQPGR
jgi:hypothetical protein